MTELDLTQYSIHNNPHVFQADPEEPDYCTWRGYVDNIECGYSERDHMVTDKPVKATDKQVGGDHYANMPVQPGDFIAKNNIPWYEGNAIKYLCRHAKKNGRQDLEKAKHYIEMALEFYYPEEDQ